ncbi:MAG: helix-turn-helix domain-containing protein [Acidobacteriota bacterium]|nr:helix-turn-helix domain-containing protein [Acidobacteriota bacterium]
MVRGKRRKPALAQKLRHIRTAMGLSQNEMIGRMGLTGQLLREEVSDFERNKRIPPLEVILQYARAANVTVEALIDDELALPERLPSPVRHEGVRRGVARRGTKGSKE